MTALKILIVEDELVTAVDIRKKLKNAGHQVTSIARTLQDAVKSVIAHPPDLALIDIRLDQASIGDGIQTAQELLDLHAMPIIYLTGSSELSTFQRAKQTMPTAYLLKPYNEHELLLHIELAYHNFKPVVEHVPQSLSAKFVLLSVKHGLEKIDLDDVVYLKADGSYAKVVLKSKAFFTVSTSLGQLKYYFQQPNFFQISRSHVVNLDYFRRIIDGDMHLLDSLGMSPLHISEKARKDLLDRLTIIRTKPTTKPGE